jgi:hypothetical protein
MRDKQYSKDGLMRKSLGYAKYPAIPNNGVI